MRIGCTGVRILEPYPRVRVLTQSVFRVIHALWPHAVIVTGACIGIDTLCAVAALEVGCSVHTIVPASRGQCDPLWREHCTSFEEMEPGTTYADRNTRVVISTQHLLAFPHQPEDPTFQDKSGTWQTIRIARRYGTLCPPFILSDARTYTRPYVRHVLSFLSKEPHHAHDIFENRE